MQLSVASPSMGRRTTAFAIAIAVVAVGLLVGGRTASAHAELLSSFPGNQELLVESPAEIALQFTEGVDPIEPGIRLVDAAGNDVEIGAVSQAAGSERMRAEVPTTLDDGTYVVAWQAVSADSHRVAARSPSPSGSPPP